MLGATAGSSSSAKRVLGFHCWASQTVAPVNSGLNDQPLFENLLLSSSSRGSVPSLLRFDAEYKGPRLEHVRASRTGGIELFP